MSRKASVLASISIIETLSFLVLLAMMFIDSEKGVSIVGMTHGLLFAAYAVLVWMDHKDYGWSTGFAVLAVFTGPIGAILVLERMRKEGLLARS